MSNMFLYIICYEEVNASSKLSLNFNNPNFHKRLNGIMSDYTFRRNFVLPNEYIFTSVYHIDVLRLSVEDISEYITSKFV